jgi:hypothetical protein
MRLRASVIAKLLAVKPFWSLSFAHSFVQLRNSRIEDLTPASVGTKARQADDV